MIRGSQLTLSQSTVNPAKWFARLSSRSARTAKEKISVRERERVCEWDSGFDRERERVCVCVRERESESEREGGREMHLQEVWRLGSPAEARNTVIRSLGRVQGYLAHKKHPSSDSRTIQRVLWWSWGGGAVSYERGTPAPVPGGVVHTAARYPPWILTGSDRATRDKESECFERSCQGAIQPLATRKVSVLKGLARER